MKKSTLFLTGSAVLLLVGCRPELAKEKFGADDAQWATRLGENYRGYQAPRTYAPALVDKYETMPAAAVPAQPEAPAAAAAPETVKDITADPVDAKAPTATPSAVKADTPAQADKGETVEEKVVKGEFYVVKNGDTLGSIAKKFYKDARRADLIYQVNSSVIKDANHVRPGTKLLIPAM